MYFKCEFRKINRQKKRVVRRKLRGESLWYELIQIRYCWLNNNLYGGFFILFSVYVYIYSCMQICILVGIQNNEFILYVNGFLLEQKIGRLCLVIIDSLFFLEDFFLQFLLFNLKLNNILFFLFKGKI